MLYVPDVADVLHVLFVSAALAQVLNRTDARATSVSVLTARQEAAAGRGIVKPLAFGVH